MCKVIGVARSKLVVAGEADTRGRYPHVRTAEAQLGNYHSHFYINSNKSIC